MRNAFEAVPNEWRRRRHRRLQLLAGAGQICLPAVVPAIVTVSLFAFITSWNEFLGALVLMSRARASRCRSILAAARQESSLGGTDWGCCRPA